jgi:nucleotide-binding universal stress UspA family protein
MFKHLLVTLDGSPRAEAVIPHAIDIAKTTGAELTLLRVVDAANSDWSERGAIGKSSAASTIRSTYVDEATAYLDRVAEQVTHAGVTAHAVVKQGQPAKQILATVKEADPDAIAMATHARRGIDRLMFGSVAEEIILKSLVPILLVRAA